MVEFFEFVGVPLGYVMSWIFNLIDDYFLTIFIFTFLVRLVLFPLSLKQQKGAMDRAKIAPRLERLQKKYANDRNKLAQKQQELYERHGVSMTGGCLPMLLSMVVLFGVIGVIYSPLSTLTSLPDEVIAVAQYGSGIAENTYSELNLIEGCEQKKDAIILHLTQPNSDTLKIVYPNDDINDSNIETYKTNFRQTFLEGYGLTPEAVYDEIYSMKQQFIMPFLGSESMLGIPWTDKGFEGITWLWIIPLISGITSFAVSFVSMRYSKRSMPKDQPGQGCTTGMMMWYMPAFSTFIAFTVPGAVGIYWIFSNLLSLLQTVILNAIYDPAKARAEAEAEYQERRRKKAEDKKRLAKARQREEAEARKAEQALERQREESREMNKKKKKKGSSAAKSAEETKQNDNGATDAVDTQPVDDTDDASSAE